MDLLSINGQEDCFTTIHEKLRLTLLKPYETEDQTQVVLSELTGIVQEIERTWLTLSPEKNRLEVKRVWMHGQICKHVKDSLLHGEWSDWARENYKESPRTMQKWMRIYDSTAAIQFAHLGSEKVYSLWRIEKQLQDGHSDFASLFTDCELESSLESYTCKEFEASVNVILNKITMQESGIELSAEALKGLSNKFSLIAKTDDVVTRLASAKKEDADLEKTAQNIMADGGAGGTSGNRKGSYPRRQDDFSTLQEKMIQLLEEAKSNPELEEKIDHNRLRFLVQVIEEYFQTVATK